MFRKSLAYFVGKAAFSFNLPCSEPNPEKSFKSLHRFGALAILSFGALFSLTGCATIYAEMTTKVQPAQVSDIPIPAGWKFSNLVKSQTGEAECAKVAHSSGAGEGIQLVCATSKLANSLRQALESSGRNYQPGAPGEDKVGRIVVNITSLEASPPQTLDFFKGFAVACVTYQVTLRGKHGVQTQSGPMRSEGRVKNAIGVPAPWAVEKAVAVASQNAALDILKWCGTIISQQETSKAAGET
jgi:hypothetical protein